MSLEVRCHLWRTKFQFANEKAYYVTVRNIRICEKLLLSLWGHGLGRINCPCPWLECMWVGRIIAPCIFKLGLKLMWATDCTAQSLYPWGHRKYYSLTWKLDGYQNRCGCFGEETKYCNVYGENLSSQFAWDRIWIIIVYPNNIVLLRFITCLIQRFQANRRRVDSFKTER